jgi:hypothetical protein
MKEKQRVDLWARFGSHKQSVRIRRQFVRSPAFLYAQHDRHHDRAKTNIISTTAFDTTTTMTLIMATVTIMATIMFFLLG